VSLQGTLQQQWVLHTSWDDCDRHPDGERVHVGSVIMLHVPEVQQAAAIAVPPQLVVVIFAVPQDESVSVTDKTML
jgi:hypothetical protein